MSTPIYEIDEQLYQKYMDECRIHEWHPSIKDFIIWCEENDHDLPEVWDGEATDVA